jgi:TatD DNase family protein
MPTFCDSHAHLNDAAFAEDLDRVLSRAAAAEVTTVVDVGYDEKTSVRALEQAVKYPGLLATVGLHPHDAKNFSPRIIDFLDSLAADPRVAAIGETGLDKYYNHSPLDIQREAFSAQIGLAERLSLPLVIHCRSAYPELVEILKKHYLPGHAPWQVHCFSGAEPDLENLIGLDCYFSLGGTVTFQNFKGQALIRRIPADRLLLETDSPYLTPHPERGKRNEPALIGLTAGAVAGIRGVSLDELSRTTNENFNRIFATATSHRLSSRADSAASGG